MNMMFFTYDREGSDANGNLVFIPSGSYRSWDEGGYSWAQGSAPNNTEHVNGGKPFRWKKLDSTSKWYHWGKYDVSDSPGLSRFKWAECLANPSLECVKEYFWWLLAIALAIYYLIIKKRK